MRLRLVVGSALRPGAVEFICSVAFVESNNWEIWGRCVYELQFCNVVECRSSGECFFSGIVAHCMFCRERLYTRGGYAFYNRNLAWTLFWLCDRRQCFFTNVLSWVVQVVRNFCRGIRTYLCWVNTLPPFAILLWYILIVRSVVVHVYRQNKHIRILEIVKEWGSKANRAKKELVM